MWILLMLLSQRAAPGAVPPPLPYYTRHVKCWCEKCDEQDPDGHWTTARALPAYGKQGVPSTKLFTVPAGEQVQVLDGVVVVDRADRIRVRQRLTMLDVPGVLEPGDVFWRVQVMPEGGATIWHDGRMLDTSLSGDEDCQKFAPRCSGIIEQKGSRQWWVKVRSARGQIGWVRADWNFVDDTCGVQNRR